MFDRLCGVGTMVVHLSGDIKRGQTNQRSFLKDISGLVTTQMLMLPNQLVGWWLGKVHRLSEQKVEERVAVP